MIGPMYRLLGRRERPQQRIAIASGCTKPVAVKNKTYLWLSGCLLLMLAAAHSPSSPELVVQTAHAGSVSFLAFSADGKSLVSEAEDGGTQVWDLGAHSIIRTWDRDDVSSNPYSPPMTVFEAPPRRSNIHETVAISPKSDHLLFGGLFGEVEEANIATGSKGRTYHIPLNLQEQPNGSLITRVTASPDGKWVVAATEEGTIVAFGTDGNAVHLIQQNRGRYPSYPKMWFSAKSDRLLVQEDDASLWLYEMATGQGIAIAHNVSNDAVAAISADGDVLVADRVWEGLVLSNLKTGVVRKVSCHCINPMLSSDGARLAAIELDDRRAALNAALEDATSTKRVRIWSTSDLRELPSLASPHLVNLTAISDDGKAVAIGELDGTVWFTTANGLVNLSGHLRTPMSLQSGDQERLLVVDTEGGIREWDTHMGSSQMILSGSVLPEDPRFAATIVSSNARFAATLRNEGRQITLFDLKTRALEKVKIGPTNGLSNNERVIGLFSISNDGNALAVISENGAAYIARRDSDWKATEVCLNATFLSMVVFYGNQLLTARCDSTAQTGLVNLGWKVSAVGVRGERAVFAGTNGIVMIIDKSGTTQIATHGLVPWRIGPPFTSVSISPNGHFAALMAGPQSPLIEAQITILDLDAKSEIAGWTPKHAIHRSPSHLDYVGSQVAISDMGTVYLVDGSGYVQAYTQQGEPLVRMISVGDYVGDYGWVAVDDAGRFDNGDFEGATSIVKWRDPEQPSHVMPLEIFMRDYYTPKLLPRMLNKEYLPEVRPISTLNRIQPKVEISGIKPKSGANGIVSVRVKVESQQSETQSEKSRPLESGVFDLRLFRDGQLVARYPGPSLDEQRASGTIATDAEREGWRNQYRIADSGARIITMANVQLPQRAGIDHVVFTAYAFNRDRVKSETSPPFPFKLSPPARPRKRRAYLITMATNANQSGWDLTLAVPSAEEAAALWTKKLKRDYEVVPVALESKTDDHGVILPNPTATKADLHAVLDILAGRERNVSSQVRKAIDPRKKLNTATPDDAVILYIASHGYADPEGRFYVIPFDTGIRARLAGVDENMLTRCGRQPGRRTYCATAQEFLDRSISSDDLSSWWQGVDAGEMVMILDSCHSAAVPGQGFRPGPLGDPGFGQLSYDKGMRILAATQPDKTARATSLNRLGHTLLVEALRIADEGPDQSITNWLRSTERLLPQRAQELYPELPEGELQLPELLDFASRESSVAMGSR
jgi:WD40 repeat protein